MIAFETLLLGLLIGVQPVSVLASEDTAAVELWLDGAVAERLEAPPWDFELDLGDELVPHRVEAVGFDVEGAEISRVEQRVNLLRQEAEAAIALESSDGVPRVARVFWRTIDEDAVETLRVTLDGRPIDVSNPERIPLPDLDLDSLHFLVAELSFQSGRAASAEVIFGGLYGDEVSVDLTAVPVVSETRPTIEQLSGRLQVAGRPVVPVGIDHGKRETFFVIAGEASRTLTRMARAASGLNLDRRLVDFEDDDQLSLLTGRSAADRAAGTDVFEVLRIVFPPEMRGPTDTIKMVEGKTSNIRRLKHFLRILGANSYGIKPRQQRVIDALAMAGLLAEGRHRPRTVVLVVEGTPKGQNRFEIEQVAHFLETLRVPLVTWNVSRILPNGLPNVVQVDTPVRAEDQVRALIDGLERQWIVWLEGRHLPQEISLEGAPGIRLLGDRG